MIGPYLCLIISRANQQRLGNLQPPASQAYNDTHTPCARRLTKVSDTGRHMSHWAQPPPNVCQDLQVHHVQNVTEDSGWLATSVLDYSQKTKSYLCTFCNVKQQRWTLKMELKTEPTLGFLWAERSLKKWNISTTLVWAWQTNLSKASFQLFFKSSFLSPEAVTVQPRWF